MAFLAPSAFNLINPSTYLYLAVPLFRLAGDLISFDSQAISLVAVIAVVGLLLVLAVVGLLVPDVGALVSSDVPCSVGYIGPRIPG